MEHGGGEAEDVVVGVVVREKLVEHFRNISEGGGVGVVDAVSERRFDDLERIEAGEFLFGFVLVLNADDSERLERSAEASFETLGSLGDAFDFAFVPREERDQQVRLMHGVGAEDDGFGELEHGTMNILPSYDGREGGRTASIVNRICKTRCQPMGLHFHLHACKTHLTPHFLQAGGEHS